ncbi:hypothetical protein [Corynebacterium pseudotuberculosis]|uniref:DUF304 domain-containing protein n=1 Tax=Corynebacterium pseudotuberculosis (strain C231) TaxID=681645 RepID=D9QEQ7_CORP2|nr:hypothetical protein [Corynebacterium pseudotuberculosis]ADL09980.1 hypothetical protein CPC231_02480 [Corynebacterium pseudotuberculosis C231]ADO25772.1 hypothetical protein CPI19_02480 [Corynebacterium pseudotuberculosis I19]AEK91824.1 Hypothetical protein CpPAT10_0494 [Corynebacterium pseudotuberculosis PAT10]AEP69749.1 Hypothetical protein Cp4202_0484 [Corynebacterium pseudotuberculosis 42/02-A]AFF21645.1 Hypothetical protein CpP54B96_0497 [Corynebacterium pseudotuberculosis P54B96]
MARVRVLPDEIVRVDVTRSLVSLIYPVCELLLITGVCWMLIGYLDRDPQDSVQLRNAVVGLWAALALWRFALPVLRARKERVIVTDQRVILRAQGIMGASESIPLRAVRHVGRKRKNISLAVSGYQRPIMLINVAKAKHVVASIEEGMNQGRGYWG